MLWRRLSTNSRRDVVLIFIMARVDELLYRVIAERNWSIGSYGRSRITQGA